MKVNCIAVGEGACLPVAALCSSDGVTTSSSCFMMLAPSSLSSRGVSLELPPTCDTLSRPADAPPHHDRSSAPSTGDRRGARSACTHAPSMPATSSVATVALWERGRGAAPWRRRP